MTAHFLMIVGWVERTSATPIKHFDTDDVYAQAALPILHDSEFHYEASNSLKNYPLGTRIAKAD
jgi:hypothetical protein